MNAAPAGSKLPRLLAGAGPGIADLDDHLALHGPLRPEPLIDLVEAAGLTGRGGAGFPTAIKLRAVASRPGPKVVVANGAEGEPASAKDALLLASLPHLVLDGAALAAAAVGAGEVYICGSQRSPAAIEGLRAALDQRRDARLGEARATAVAVPAGFVSGEESALVNFVHGGPLRPTAVPPRPYERGVGRRPTLVQNVETLAHIALIARNGADWFRELGPAAEPGSTLVTLSGAVAAPGVYEIERGMALDELIAGAGGTLEPLQAALVGGYFGTWVAGDALGRALLADHELARWGAALGSGVIIALGASACAAAELARGAAYLAAQSARQCGPCVHGLGAVASMLIAIVQGRAGSDGRARIERWLDQIVGRGACHHPNGAVRFVASGIELFGEALDEHARLGPCEGCAQAPVLPTPAASVADDGPVRKPLRR